MNQEQKISKSDIILSTTDLNSHIKYANQSFCNIAGYSLDEMVGQPHSMVRHNDMPKAAFKNLWSYIQDGKSWMGPVKNKCKNGNYYWVNAFVTPIRDEQGQIHEYQSVRTCLDDDVVKRTDKVYNDLSNGKVNNKLSRSTDQTLWIKWCLLTVTFLSFLNLFYNEINPINVLILLIVGCATAVFLNWRQKYIRVVKQAKAIFDNPLMTYLYSGNNDDVGLLALAFKKREAEISAIVGRVSDISQSITTTAQQSSEHGSNVAQILSEQRHETEQVAAASNEMSATVREITQTVNQATQSSNQGLIISSEGQVQIQKTTDAINQLSSQLTYVDTSINKLTEGCRSIESVSNEISSIAEQTNLLALNAAIEAARAGEQGRGFAVVADEVRALAQRTQQSTQEINKLLTQLMQASDSAVQAMNEGNRLSDTCVSLSQQTGQSLQKVHHEVSELASISQQISEAIAQQAIAAEDVNQNIIAISDMSTQSEEHGRASTELSLNLLSKLQEQQRLIIQFKKH
jgi:PAS domain S-box-containing protein